MSDCYECGAPHEKHPWHDSNAKEFCVSTLRARIEELEAEQILMQTALRLALPSYEDFRKELER